MVAAMIILASILFVILFIGLSLMATCIALTWSLIEIIFGVGATILLFAVPFVIGYKVVHKFLKKKEV